MTEKEFVQSYIKKINDAINEFSVSECNENIIFDCIQEIRGVFCRDIPEIDEAIWMRTGTAERDANIVLGLLNKRLIDKDSVPNDSEAKSDQYLRDYKDLKLEFEGIRKNIDDYTSEGNIINYLSQLDKAIKENDLYVIKYCLKGIQKWYKANIDAIHQNEFCINPESHDENQGKIDRFIEIFSSYSESDICTINTKEGQAKDNSPLIFLSHKSDDKKYADALERFIIGLGVKNNQLIYTSHPLHKIPLDTNIYDYLREHIYNQMFMIILWSDKYIESPACLNEMGAAWLAQSDYTNIYVPNFSFGNPKYHECAVDTRKMGAVLNGDNNCKASMLELKEKIQRLFQLEDEPRNAQYLIDKFIEEIVEEKS